MASFCKLSTGRGIECSFHPCMPLRALHLLPLRNAAKSNSATSSLFTFNLKVAASRAWSRRAIDHAQPKIPTQDTHGTTRGKNSTKSGFPILTAGPSRYTLYFHLSVPNTYSNGCRIVGAPSISGNAPQNNAPQNAQVDGNPIAHLASNKKKTIPAVLRGKQKWKQHHVPITSAPIAGPVPGCIDFDPVLNNYEPTHTDLYFEEAPLEDCLKNIPPEYLSSCLTPVGIEARPLMNFPLPIPTSCGKLYRNLVHILRLHKPRPILAAIVDYHLLFPDYHSTKSYNLLIFLSLRHRAYGTTYTLFRAMRERSLRENMETYRLRIRWYIHQGFWDKAWSYATQLANKFPGGGLPFPIWSEFCETRKAPIVPKNKLLDANPQKKFARDFSEPTSIFSVRRQIMDTNRPLLIPALKDTPPAAIRSLVQLMVKGNRKHQALKFTEDYFKTLPLKMNRRTNHRCLDIVKIHLTCNGTGKTGVPRFNATKNLLFSLLSLNPSLRPTSDTLIYTLSTLKRAKRCGTIAWNFISLCKEKWGSEMENRRIQRYVLKWALKEGRMDIVNTITQAEALQRRSRQRRLLELRVVGDLIQPRARSLHRPAVRRIYPRHGKEAQLWRRIQRQIRRKILKHLAKGYKLTKAPRLSAPHRSTKSIPH